MMDTSNNAYSSGMHPICLHNQVMVVVVEFEEVVVVFVGVEVG